jgi:hypothetical protein
MFRITTLRATLFLCVLAAVATIAPAPFASTPQDEPIPWQLQGEIEDVLDAKLAKLVNDKSLEGVNLRGTYSKDFRKVDESTFHVSFHQDTAEEEWLKTERMRLTISNVETGNWEISEHEVLDTVQVLCRSIPGDEDFYRFDSFEFESEGMKLSGGSGTLYRDFLNGEPDGFQLVADNLTYHYTPPTDVDFYQIDRAMKADYPDDLEFDPEWVAINCDPVSCKGLLDGSFTGLTEITKEELGKGLLKEYEKGQKDLEESRKENPFRGFQRLPEPERRSYAVYIKRDSPRDHYNFMFYDSYSPWEVYFGASGFGVMYGYYSEETRKSGKDPYELERRDDSSARYYELYSLKGEVELGLENSDEMKGDVTFGVHFKQDMKEIPFFIARVRPTGGDTSEGKDPKMFVNSVQDADGNELTWVRTSPVSGLIVLKEEVKAGARELVRMQWEARDALRKLNPSYSNLSRGGWLPFVRFGDMIDEFEMTVKVPSKYKTLGIGTKVDEKIEGDVNITRWKAHNAVEFPTVIFGDYIEGGAKIKATKSDGTEIPVRVFVDKVSTNILDEEFTRRQDIDSLTSGARGIRGRALTVIAEQAINALNLYREVYGVDYPYGKLDLVADPSPALYGQAPSSIVYLGATVFRGEGAVAADTGFFGGGGESSAKFIKSVVAHEVGHQWWGSVIAHANNRNYWFMESLAEYSSALYLENAFNRKEYQEQIEEWRNNVLRWDMMSSVQNSTALWSGEYPGRSRTAAIYNKGPYAFHILRSTFGDEKFFKFLKMLAQEFQGKEIVTRDIQLIAEKSYGVPMDWFFDQWIRGIGIPEYSFNYTSRRTEEGSYIVQGVVRQRVVTGKNKHVMEGVYYLGVVPITVKGRKKNQVVTKPIRIEGPESQFGFKIPFEPLDIFFNENGEILAHDVLVNRDF